jgi:hypothetical protein
VGSTPTGSIEEETTMRTIHTDLSARTADHCILLPAGSIRGLCVRAGDRVRLHGADVEVEACIEVRAGATVAVPQWDTVEYVD